LPKKQTLTLLDTYPALVSTRITNSKMSSSSSSQITVMATNGIVAMSKEEADLHWLVQSISDKINSLDKQIAKLHEPVVTPTPVVKKTPSVVTDNKIEEVVVGGFTLQLASSAEAFGPPSKRLRATTTMKKKPSPPVKKKEPLPPKNC
jgi:ribosome-associated translation inhibitor RaiA